MAKFEIKRIECDGVVVEIHEAHDYIYDKAEHSVTLLGESQGQWGRQQKLGTLWNVTSVMRKV